MKFEKLVKYVIPLFAFAIVCRSVEAISVLYYLVPILCLLFIALMFFDSTIKIPNKSKNQFPLNIIRHPFSIFFLPGIWFLVTAFWSSSPEISAARSLYFILLSTGCIAAGIMWSQYSGKNILDFLIPSNIFVVIVCLFSIITSIPSDSWTGGNGKGLMSFFGHQNLLASIILFTLPAIVGKVFQLVKEYKSNSSITTNYLLITFYFFLLASNLLLLTLTYSRASLLALIVGVLGFLILNKNWRVLVSGLVVVITFTLILLFIPALNQQAETIIKKDFPELSTTRIFMWEASYLAALDGGLTGLGYGISDPNEKYGGEGDHFEGERFIREKGNSTLALIEETGIIGLLLFIIPLVYILIHMKRKVILSPSTSSGQVQAKNPNLHNTNCSLITAALAAMLLHAQFEAWWVGVGSVQLPLFYIYFGLLVNGSMFEVD